MSTEVPPVATDSPRSTCSVLKMTTDISMTGKLNVAKDVAAGETKTSSPSKNRVDGADSDAVNPATSIGEGKDSSADNNYEEAAGTPSDNGEREGSRSSPSAQHMYGNQLQQGQPSNRTPQTQQGTYYVGYAQPQMTPEPPSPADPDPTIVYNVGSFLQQPGSFGPNHTPLSPPRVTATLGAASPLFPRSVNNAGTGGLVVGAANSFESRTAQQLRPPNSPSPNLNYMTSPQVPASMLYQNYPMNAGTGGPRSNNSPEEGSGWPDSHAYPQGSPTQKNPAGVHLSYGVRTPSFDETLLPPAVPESPDHGNPPYSPYAGSQGSPVPGGATLFAHQQPWAYGGPQDMGAYGSGGPLQPRPQLPMPYPLNPMGGQMQRPMGGYGGQYYQASSPGPPIQTTASNKGPEGANLFIFHIPNHFTNLDMYQLFCPYGNLLSVRIMVEKDTGRSRGFGFVSYNSPESAALAIKELNGFAIGNKRLKVQHKQIRQKDMQDSDNLPGRFPAQSSQEDFQESQFCSSLPPSGAMTSQNLWYDRKNAPSNDEDDAPSEIPVKTDESTELNCTSNGGEVNLQMGANGSPSATMSPLTSLSTLQTALPDVPGKGTTE